MPELWDAYDKEGNKLGFDLVRGEPIPDGVYNLVVQVFAVSADGKYASFTADEAFLDFYLNFDGKNTYTYDPFADREATWVFYQTGENEGFISFYAELDVSEGNPDPISCPEIRYEADTNTMYIALSNYGSFMITLELTR